jgi:cytochrome c oxidase assembly protein subunit 11
LGTPKLASPDAAASAPNNARVALICAGVFVTMVGAAFAAVPFYQAFCRATGFNGAVRRAGPAQGTVSADTVVVRFDTNVHGIDWRFEPVQASQVVHFGENKLAFFRAVNLSGHTLTGRALYNVLPEAAGPYFSKVECFCFKNQTLAPGQSAEFPVVYTVDHRFAQDRDTRGQAEITLSYTFFPAVARSSPGSHAVARLGAGFPAATSKPTPVALQAASPLGGGARARL